MGRQAGRPVACRRLAPRCKKQSSRSKTSPTATSDRVVAQIIALREQLTRDGLDTGAGTIAALHTLSTDACDGQHAAKGGTRVAADPRGADERRQWRRRNCFTRIMASRPTTEVSARRTTAQANPKERTPSEATFWMRSPSNNPAMRLMRQNTLRVTAAIKPIGGRVLRAASHARTSCATPIGSGAVSGCRSPTPR